MKKRLLFSIIFISFLCNSHICSAQNYQCLQGGVKHYFINGNGYLRGIRIDSIIASGDTTIYYPFHTPRGSYENFTFTDGLDSTGGSWLGKKVLQLNDGTFIFDSYWNDSVIVKTQANLGDSWIFYKDTSSLSYKATVISVDTQTVLGILDTVKVIEINAYNDTSLFTSDPVNNFQMVLSKNHGFVNIFDLYTFPYHKPDSLYVTGLDYFLDIAVNSTNLYSSVYYTPFSSQPDQNNSIFKLIKFVSPTQKELYNWHVGDICEYKECFSYLEFSSIPCDPADEYLLDTIKAIDATIGNTQYSYEGLKSSLIITGTGPTTSYYTSANSGNNNYDTSLVVDTIIMPEEFRQSNLYYYCPYDSSYCTQSPLYVSIGSTLSGVQYDAVFEASTATIINKMGVGLIQYNQWGEDAGYDVDDTTLIYFYRDGQSCGGYYPLALTEVRNITSGQLIQTFPNPANEELNITSTDKITDVIVTDIVGQTVLVHQYNSEKVQVDISSLATGIYLIRINGAGVRKFVKE